MGGPADLKITLLNVTQDPGPLLESIAEISYVTQRFAERKCPKLIKFKSGRVIPFHELGLSEDPEIGLPIPGYAKDDRVVEDIIPASWERVVRFLRMIGHMKPFECCDATFKLEGISRKCALHLLRYEYITTNMRSQKYQPQDQFNFILPTKEESTAEQRRRLTQCMSQIQIMYEDLRKTGLDPEFSRGVFPNLCEQTMTIKSNFRQWRHIFDVLCEEDYVSETKSVSVGILKLLKEAAPIFFEDFELCDDGTSYKRKRIAYCRNLKPNWFLPQEEKDALKL